ncbi:MAG: hypothetical protein K2X01_03895 [Cyanobacteria bacterium]|nr:hypothetical protein [Cyanobacteriota bacterium]
MSTPNFGAELELMDDHLEQGDIVHVLKCTGQLASCHVNQAHWLSKCFECQEKFNLGLKQVEIPASNIHTLKTYEDSYTESDISFNTLEELKNYKINGIDFGEAVASSIITETKNYKLDTIANKSTVRTKLMMAYQVYLNFIKVIEEIEPDRVYVFNGRLAETRPVVRVCQQKNIDVHVIERADNYGHYMISVNCLSHEMAFMKREIESYWQDDNPNKYHISEQWYLDRRNAVDQGYYSFVKHQEPGKLPLNFNPEHKNIAIFVSSEYEFATFPDWKNQIYLDQRDGLIQILESLQKETNLRLWIRLHPNLKKDNSDQLLELQELDRRQYKHAEFIWPKETINSYTLMDHCDQTLTFGSTVGVEATFWGKPSILAGRGPYEDLDVVYRPTTHSEVMALLESDLSPKSKSGALKYGYRMMANGIPYKKFLTTDICEGSFKGEKITSEVTGLKNYVYYKALRKIDKFKHRFKKIFC